MKSELSKPTLIMGVGTSGVGKTTFLRELAMALQDTVFIDKDTINEGFLGTRDPEDKSIKRYTFPGARIRRDDDLYHAHVKFQSYHTMLEMARDNLRLGKHPILDGNYSYEITQGYMHEVAFPFFEGVECNKGILLMHVDGNVLRQRITERGLERDADKLVSDEAWISTLERHPIIPEEVEQYSHLKIDTARPLAENIIRAQSYLAKL